MKYKELAIIGATASGKSALALELAQKHNCHILSLDSLALYKEIDIASAKPTKEELYSVKHFGIDEIYPNEHFSARLFFDLYNKAKEACLQDDKSLIIVGGTSFYLHSMIYGLSELPSISDEAKVKAQEELKDKDEAYTKLCKLDTAYANKIASNDTYRITKAYEIYYETGQIPSIAFAKSAKEIICPDMAVFEIEIDRGILREKIRARTQKMFDDGLIDEVKTLEAKYGRELKSMKSIGIKEVLDFVDGKTTIEETKELISIHTGQLAKRQDTFNRHKFPSKTTAKIDGLRKTIWTYIA